MTSVTIDAESLQRLVAEAQQGERLAADRLVREHAGWVRSVIYGVTGRADSVDDIAQQVWARVWESLGTLEDPRRLRAWLGAIARNTAIDASVKQRRWRDLAGRLDDKVETPARSGKSPFAVAVGNEVQQILLRGVRSLPALYREPFVLRHLEDWSYAEIGEVLSLPVETVETRLVRARRLLRELLEGKVEL